MSALLCAWLAGWAGLGQTAPPAPLSPADRLLNQAQAAQLRGDSLIALDLADQAAALEPQNPQCYYVRGRLRAAQRQPAGAIEDFNRVLAAEPRAAEVHQLRGFEQFKLGRFAEAIADFNQFLKAAPQEEPRHWQRGIAFYHAGRHEEGRRQFELHQTVRSNDVENAAWHFLCTARLRGLDEARAALLPVEADPRLPMMQVYALFAGKGSPEEVLASAQGSDSSEAQLRQQLFWAHLYVGLHHEVTGDLARAREHVGKAAEDYSQTHYMGEVARVHAAWLGQQGK